MHRDPPRLSKLNKSSLPKEAVVVEVRVANNGNVASNSLDGKYGPVVGEVVFLTEVCICVTLASHHS